MYDYLSIVYIVYYPKTQKYMVIFPFKEKLYLCFHASQLIEKIIETETMQKVFKTFIDKYELRIFPKSNSCSLTLRKNGRKIWASTAKII